MILTSLNRVLINLSEGEPYLSTDYERRRRFIKRIASVSSDIEDHLNRNIELKSYTEFFDTLDLSLEYSLKAFPISALTSVYSDITGLYDGGESLESDYIIGKNNDTVCLASSISQARKGLRVIYTGGLATHAVRSTFTLSSEGASPFTAGMFVTGGSSNAMGIVVSKASTTMVIEVLYGIFEVGEIVSGKTTETGAVTSGVTAVLSARTVTSLAESYPNIVEATEMEIRYRDDHRSDYENLSTDKGSTTRKDLTKNYDLLPEVRKILQPYVKFNI
jgi:hypothetical protein